MEEQIEWSGMGRWLSFLFTALMILVAIPGVFSHEFGAAAGWNLFLGLLMFGFVAAGHRKAPLLAAILTVLMLLRLVLGAIAGGGWAILADAVLLLVIAGAAYDLRQQDAES
jgi:hypothetical protein